MQSFVPSGGFGEAGPVDSVAGGFGPFEALLVILFDCRGWSCLSEDGHLMGADVFAVVDKADWARGDWDEGGFAGSGSGLLVPGCGRHLVCFYVELLFAFEFVVLVLLVLVSLYMCDLDRAVWCDFVDDDQDVVDEVEVFVVEGSGAPVFLFQVVDVFYKSFVVEVRADGAWFVGCWDFEEVDVGFDHQEHSQKSVSFGVEGWVGRSGGGSVSCPEDSVGGADAPALAADFSFLIAASVAHDDELGDAIGSVEQFVEGWWVVVEFGALVE